ncbi:alpha/beta fold hydrolase [Nocardia panacis]|nr:hypothetical protein [Nocardia panacis]
MRTTDSVASADGTRIVFHTLGDGPPLVIVHGALVTTEAYRPMAELLATSYRVVLIGRRDYAPSGNGPRPSTFIDAPFPTAPCAPWEQPWPTARRD